MVAKGAKSLARIFLRFFCLRLEFFLTATIVCSVGSGRVQAEVTAAVIGDYGADNSGEAAVANLIKDTLRPDIVVTAGDNNYGDQDDIDRAIGKYYYRYIGNYKGDYGSGASTNRFFPAIGNHDWHSSDGYGTYLWYFTLPGNERYYQFRQGPIHWFILNSEEHEPDGNGRNSKQALWFSNQVTRSTAPWKIAVIHDPPYSSSSKANPHLRWPFRQWGVTAVLSGDAHNYERIMRDGIVYIINGAGGQDMFGFGDPVEGSVIRYRDNYGAMLINAEDDHIRFRFYSISPRVVDTLELRKPSPPVSPPLMKIQRVGSRMVITWSGSSSFILEEATTPLGSPNWVKSPEAVGVTNGVSTVSLVPGSSNKFFRLRKS